MKQLIAIVTALHVLAHGVFGCCDEVGHASASEVHESICHHAHHDPHVEASAGGAQSIDMELPAPAPHECIHNSCHWVVGDSIQKLSLVDLSLVTIGHAAAVRAAGATQAVHLPSHLAAGPLSAPPVRLHLALGVILV